MNSLIIAVAVLFMSVLFFGLSFEFPRLAADPGGPALYPRIVAVVTAIACVMYGVQYLLSRKPEPSAKEESKAISDWWSAAAADKFKILSFAFVILLPALIQVIGFVPAIFLFVFALMALSGVGLIRSLITAALGCAGIYAGYAWALGAVLPKGFLFG